MHRAIIFALLWASPALADPVEGIWRTEPGDTGNTGHVRIAPCGDKICGTIVGAFGPGGAAIESENIGKTMIWDMVPAGGGSYRGGQIWAPDRDKVYASKMQLDGDSLSVAGCVLFICRSQLWVRVK